MRFRSLDVPKCETDAQLIWPSRPVDMIFIHGTLCECIIWFTVTSDFRVTSRPDRVLKSNLKLASAILIKLSYAVKPLLHMLFNLVYAL